MLALTNNALISLVDAVIVFFVVAFVIVVIYVISPIMGR